MNIREDILTPRERAKAFSEGKPMDRIICVPMVAISAAYLIGKTIKEFQLDPEVMAQSHIAAYKRFKYDSVGLSTNCSVLAEAMGAKAYRITKKEEVENVLKEAIALKQPVLIECIIDSDDKVWPMVAPGAAIEEVFSEEDLNKK